MIVLNGMLSQESNAIFQRKLERLAREFDEMAKEDVTLPMSERLGYTSVLAVRDWRFTVFDTFKKNG